MSDYFLNRIYDSLLNKKPVPKKPENLNEKKETSAPATLQQAYYRIRVEQINEATDILMQQEPSGDVEEFKVSDDLANKIKKDIKRETKISTEDGETSINESLAAVLTNKGWKESNPEYGSVLQRVIEAFDTGDVIPEEIVKYPKLAAQTNNPVEVAVIQKPNTVSSLQDLIPSWFNNFFTDKNGLPIANQIWNIDFSAKGGTKVGKLELLLTLISSGKKGSVGDIHFEGYGEVEVKGLGARMGGDAFAPTRTPDELNKILGGGESDALFKKTSERYKRELIAYLDKNMSEKIKNQADIIPLQKTKSDILAARSYQEIITDLEELIKPYKGKSGREIFGKAPFIKVVNKVITDLQKYIEREKEPVVGGFNESINSFFGFYKELTDDQLIDGIVATRNYAVLGAVPALREAIKNIVNREKNNLFTEQKVTQSMRRLIAAIHMTLYYYVQKFKGILFANDTSKKVVYFAFNEQSSLEENIISCYNFFNAFNAEIGLSLDKRSSSAGIELKI